MSGQRVFYICGPMSGYPDFNYPAFHKAAEMVQANFPDARVINPAENFHGQKGLAYKIYIRKSFEQVLESTDLYVLPGWIASKGATAEVKMAELLDLRIRFEQLHFASFRVNPIELTVLEGGLDVEPEGDKTV